MSESDVPTANSPTQERIRVLILSRDPAHQGGVVNFTEMLKSRLGNDIIPYGMVIGRRPNETLGVETATRILADPVRLLLRMFRERYDVVHVNPSLMSRSVIRDGVFCVLMRVFGYRNVFIFFRGWSDALEHRLFSNAIGRMMFRMAFGGAARIAVLSQRFKESLVSVGLPADRIVVLTTMFDGNAIDDALRLTRRSVGRRSILFLGRLVREKGLFELIDAFAQIRDRFADVDLVIAGNGDEMAATRERIARLGISDRVRLAGYVRGDEKARVLIGSSIFALPSYYPEGLPNAMLEAMGAGAALVVSDVGGIGEAVREPENGIILDHRRITTEAVADALTRLLSDPKALDAIRRRNQLVAWEKFEARIVTSAIEDIYREIAAAMPSGCGGSPSPSRDADSKRGSATA